jgi:outer membrane protein TolC
MIKVSVSIAILVALAGCQSVPPWSSARQAATGSVAAQANATPPVGPVGSGPGQTARVNAQVVRLPEVSAARAINPAVRTVSAQTTGPESLPTENATPREEAPSPEAERTLSLTNALAMGLSDNPDLITLRGTANVSAAAAQVAGVYPWNPFVQAQYFPNGSPFVQSNVPGNTVGQSNYYVWLMQRFELGHQRRYREDSANAALGQVRWNIRVAELNNIAQTERLFFAALYQRQLLDLAADADTLGSRFAEVVERRFQANLANSLQLANTRVAARQARRQYQLAESSYQASLLALRQQLGLPADAPLNPVGDLTKFQWFSVASVASRVAERQSTSSEALAAEVAEARPDVMAARAAIGVAQGNLDLARGARRPDVQAGPIYETGSDNTRFIGLRLQRDLAIFNNGSALVAQRQTELQQQCVAYEQLKRRARIEAAAAIDRYERARRFAADVARDTAGAPPLELNQVMRQFEAGNAEIIDVLAVQNNLLLEVRATLDLLNEVAQSAALVTQATSLPPERLYALRPPDYRAGTRP